MKIPENTQMSTEFWREVERAKKLTPDERVREGCALFERALVLMTAGIRAQFPEVSDGDVMRIRRERLARIQALDARP